jgi:hypothetical protein
LCIRTELRLLTVTFTPRGDPRCEKAVHHLRRPDD